MTRDIWVFFVLFSDALSFYLFVSEGVYNKIKAAMFVSWLVNAGLDHIEKYIRSFFKS
jgi:regulatory protein YycH of two-component signal transduction system YycFG